MAKSGRPLAYASAALLLVTSCTGASSPSTAGTTPPPPPTTSATSTASEDPSPVGPLVLDAPLPTSCEPGEPQPGQSVAFVVAGAAWALDPDEGSLTCLFELDDPGPFSWGPQGDKVLLSSMHVQTLDGSGTFLDEPETEVFAFGRPIGKSIVWRAAEDEGTRKLTFGDESVVSLTGSPDGVYQDISYHPSGLALALSVLDEDGTPQIFVSTNEGERAQRLVVGRSAISFPSAEFTADGRFLLYLAEHKGGFAQLHALDLENLQDGLVDLWTSDAGVEASGLRLPPGSGDTMAFTTGVTCDEQVAMIGSGAEFVPAVEEGGHPTRALGYLDERTLLVAMDGCGEPVDLYAVTETSATLLVTEVDVGASRMRGTSHAAPLPEEIFGNVEEFG